MEKRPGRGRKPGKRTTSGTKPSSGARARTGPKRAVPRNPSTRRRSFRSRSAEAKAPKKSWWRRAIRAVSYWSAVACVWGLVIIAGVFAYYAAGLPQISDLQVPKRAPNVVIVDMSGAVMASRGIGHGRDIRIEQLPAYLPQAVIAIEDRRFRYHFGVDIIGLARASMRNMWAGHIIEGGSTLTQQLAKNLFLEPDRTIRRKIQEMILAVWLEANYSKDEILELYLNRVYFGVGSYGVEAASRRYFGKSARHVTLSEAAILAGLLKAPSRYAPTRNPRGANARARIVLANMVEEGFITDIQRRGAQDHRAVLMQGSNAGSVHYIADWVVDILPGYVGQPESDITVVTTIDLDLQAAAEIAVRNGLAAEGETRNVTQGALVAVDTSGQVRAMIGGVSYAQSQFNRATRAHRQPGSAFKPFVYLAAIERGLTADTIRRDSPIKIGNWSPKNYSESYQGDMSLRYALSHSVNTIAARLVREVGPETVARVAHRLGIQSKLHTNASIALGTAEVTLFELTAAYTPFANGGYGVIPHVISEIRDASGTVIYQVSGSGPGRVVSTTHTAIMNDMLQATIDTGTGRRAAFGWPAAGKTGTSQDFRDAWFMGYTADLVAGVWVGNDDGRPTNRVTGGGLPAQIWRQFMAAAHEGKAIVALSGFHNVPLPVLRADPIRPESDSGRDSAHPLAPPLALDNQGNGGNRINGNILTRIFGGDS